MNDLALYRTFQSQIRPGDLIVFYGDSFISWWIKLFAGAETHVGAIRQAAHPSEDAVVLMIEATIEGDKDGVQTNKLEERLLNYKGSVAWCPLSESSRKCMNWQDYYAFCGACQDSVRYDKAGLLEVLIAGVPILGPRIYQDLDYTEMFCSAFVCALWSKGGLLRGINWRQMKPIPLLEMKLFDGYIPLIGKPRRPARFNTI